MCSSPKPPDPVAPPAPIPVSESNIDATRARQTAARRSAESGYDSTVLTGPGGLAGNSPTTKPTLGG